MKNRLPTLIGILVSLLALAALFNPPGRAPEVSRPTSEDDGGNGYLGLRLWLEYSRIPHASLRRRFTEMAEKPELTGQGHVMITTQPYARSLAEGEADALSSWVGQGNTLLVLAALNDSPSWILVLDTGRFRVEMKRVTGLLFEPVYTADGESLEVGSAFGTTDLELTALARHPLLDGVRSLRGVSDSTSSIWQPQLGDVPFPVLRMATESSTGTDAMWQLPYLQGNRIVSASGTLLANRVLGEADNPVFFSNLLRAHLGADGLVIFDDYHQGLSDTYDPEAFFGDNRLHYTLLFILLFWIIYLVGTSARLVAPRAAVPVPRQSDLVRAIGGFMTRKLGRAETGKLLVESWFEELQRSGHLSEFGGSPWEQLQRMPQLPSGLVQSVRRDYAALGAGEKVDITGLYNKILKLKRALG